MGLLRSESIIHKKIRMPGNISNAVKVMEKIGREEEDLVEFINITENDIESQKNFLPYIERCDILINKINNILNFSLEYGITLPEYENYKEFINDLKDEENNNLKIENEDFFDHIENHILEEDKKFKELVGSYNKIKNELILDIEKKMCYEKYFSLTNINNINNNLNNSINSNYSNNNNNELNTIIGLCEADIELKFKRTLFRIGHNKIISTFFDTNFPEKYQPKKTMKIFIIFSPQSEVLINKINYLCDIYNCIKFDLPEENNNNINLELESIALEKENYLKESKQSIQNYLNENIKSKKFLLYKLYLKKQKYIYDNLSKCILRDNFIDGEIFVLSKNLNKLKYILQTEDENQYTTLIDLVDFNINFPTYLNTNSFLFPFQSIVNQYGIPNYNEINPGYFTVITFPFFFGIMFGDVGHGLILLSIAMYFYYHEKYFNKNYKKNELINGLNQYKSFLMLCGIYSIFCGLLYNEFFSITLISDNTCYINKNSNSTELIKDQNCTYYFGMDPTWNEAENSLTFTNSLKMKISVIIGVIQMIFGVILKGINDTIQGKVSNILFEFIPQIIFMISLLGYMIYMIFYKWLTKFENRTPPSIITIMINIIIKKGRVDGNPLLENIDQEKLNEKILFICIICSFVMFFCKPIIDYIINNIGSLNQRNRKFYNKNKENNLIDNEENPNDADNIINSNLSVEIGPNQQVSNLYDKQRNKNKNNIENSFIDMMVEQMIITIEFILGSVSNTASYLRLWALSLAHSQLSKVFIEKTFLSFLNDKKENFLINIFLMSFCFFLFLNITLFVLIFMDALECALHTLRLHWVEFQNKFYKGEGFLFKSFSFKWLIEDEIN